MRGGAVAANAGSPGRPGACGAAASFVRAAHIPRVASLHAPTAGKHPHVHLDRGTGGQLSVQQQPVNVAMVRLTGLTAKGHARVLLEQGAGGKGHQLAAAVHNGQLAALGGLEQLDGLLHRDGVCSEGNLIGKASFERRLLLVDLSSWMAFSTVKVSAVAGQFANLSDLDAQERI